MKTIMNSIIVILCLSFMMQESYGQGWVASYERYNFVPAVAVPVAPTVYGENRPMLVYYVQPIQYNTTYYNYYYVYPYGPMVSPYSSPYLYAPGVPVYIQAQPRCRLFKY
jgi:hypothetical protein